MTKDEARIVLLERELVASTHTIEFLDACLNWQAKYAYPEMTVEQLRRNKALVEIPEGCVHAMIRESCPACLAYLDRSQKYEQAERILNNG